MKTSETMAMQAAIRQASAAPITKCEFTPEQTRLFKYFKFYADIPPAISKLLILLNEQDDKSIYNIAVEMKKRNSFNPVSFSRMIYKLQKSHTISIKCSDGIYLLAITDDFIHTILQM